MPINKQLNKPIVVIQIYNTIQQKQKQNKSQNVYAECIKPKYEGA